MGKPDTALKVWLSNPVRFADLFNATLFQGQHIVDASQLEIINSEHNIIVTDKEDSQKPLQRFRDIIMHWNNNPTLIVLACENQEHINYGMPVRNMLYDSMAYSNQIQQISNTITDDNKSIPDIYYKKELKT